MPKQKLQNKRQQANVKTQRTICKTRNQRDERINKRQKTKRVIGHTILLYRLCVIFKISSNYEANRATMEESKFREEVGEA